MSLSSLIVQRGVATMRQVEEALARQVIYGGDLATNLLEVARVDEAALTTLVAESMGLPQVPAGELPVATGAARQLVPEGIAAQRAIVPLALEGQTLVLAVAEAIPAELERELAFALGVEIAQRAALTVRVRQAIARVYNAVLERRMQRLLAQLSGQMVPAGSMPPPLASAPPLPASAPAMPPAPHPWTDAVGNGGRIPSMPRRTSARPPSEPGPGLLERKLAQSARAPRRRRGPLTIEGAKREAEEATDRDALLDLYFDFTRQFFDFAALFLVHGDIAEGRDAFGVGASRERVVGIGVPLDLSGLMATARDKRAPVVAKAPADGVDSVLLADLQRSRDAEIAIVPLVVRTRAVALLLGDCGDTGVDRDALQQVVAFASTIGKAFERIIVRRKLDGFIAGSSTASTAHVDVPPKVNASVRRPSIVPAPNALDPPPRTNLATMRPIKGPPIPREEPESPGPVPVARASAMAMAPPWGEESPDPTLEVKSVDEDAAAALFEETSWEVPSERPGAPAPPSGAISAAPHAPPPPRESQSPRLPSAMLERDTEAAAIIDRLVGGANDEAAEAELLGRGERAVRALMERFPGPVTVERAKFATMSPSRLPRASECGVVLRLVARQRRVALPFVVERLKAEDSEVRGWATHLLGDLPYLEALPDLLLRLHDPDAAIRKSALYAVGALGRTFPRETRDALLALTRNVDPAERAAAFRAMGALREPTVVPELVRALADGSEAVVRATHEALLQVTLQDFGTDARPWLRWWEQNAARHRIEWLIDALTHEASEVRRDAGEELRASSKEYFGYAADLPPRDRERAQQRYRDWWATEGKMRFRR